VHHGAKASFPIRNGDAANSAGNNRRSPATREDEAPAEPCWPAARRGPVARQQVGYRNGDTELAIASVAVR
jgi:hypothetical protein